MATTGNVFVSGEITSKASINVEEVVRNTLKEIGYVIVNMEWIAIQ
ncbi:hypothetical protein CM15mP37_05010 [bacterium]|nr:MAG: hypothetical protein CM15mP37_05010 [bacterium]